MSTFIKALLICGLIVVVIGCLSYTNSSQSAPINPAELAKYNAVTAEDILSLSEQIFDTSNSNVLRYYSNN